jgi:hypothetical protein
MSHRALVRIKVFKANLVIKLLFNYNCLIQYLEGSDLVLRLNLKLLLIRCNRHSMLYKVFGDKAGKKKLLSLVILFHFIILIV